MGRVAPGRLAVTQSDLRQKRAKVILPPDHMTRAREKNLAPDDCTDYELIEETVLHELIHLCQQPWVVHIGREIEWLVGTSGTVGDPIRSALEEMCEAWVNDRARVLLDADRGKWSPPLDWQPPQLVEMDRTPRCSRPYSKASGSSFMTDAGQSFSNTTATTDQPTA